MVKLFLYYNLAVNPNILEYYRNGKSYTEVVMIWHHNPIKDIQVWQEFLYNTYNLWENIEGSMFIIAKI